MMLCVKINKKNVDHSQMASLIAQRKVDSAFGIN